MCNFNKQDDDMMAFIHLFMQKAAQSIGGENFLLSLIETIKTKKPYPLMQKNMQISSNNSIIKWNKVVFQDKVELIQELIIQHKKPQNTNLNILEEKNTKKRKNILNMIKTLTPIEFIVTPQNKNDGNGFNFKVFDTISNDEVRLNPIFIAIFFCSVEFTKKALKHKTQ